MDGVMFWIVRMILTKSRKSKVTRMPADQTFDLFWGILINQMKVLILNIQAVPSSRIWEGSAAVEHFKSEKPSRQPVVGIFWSQLSTTYTFIGWRVGQKSIMKSQGSHTMLNSEEGLVSCDTFVIVGEEGVRWNNSRIQRHDIVENHHHNHDQVADQADQGGVWQELWPTRGRGARGRGGGLLPPVSSFCVFLCFCVLVLGFSLSPNVRSRP